MVAHRAWLRCRVGWVFLGFLTLSAGLTSVRGDTVPLRVGVAQVDITNRETGPVSSPLYAKAMVIDTGSQSLVIITMDVVAIGEIGPIPCDFLAKLREHLSSEMRIDPQHVLVNASHCHGIVCGDVLERTLRAVREAKQQAVPVTVGWGSGREDRIMQNRRLRLKDGTEVDVRHAYALPPDEEVAELGPVDPTIGVLRFDRADGRPLACLFHFACHPIQGVPSHANTADITGFASQVIADNFGHGCIAFFLQGCAGDINPIYYKDVEHPRDAETLGNLLALSTLKAARAIATGPVEPIEMLHKKVSLPRADLSHRISELEVERERLVNQLQGTSLNIKTFVPLLVKYRLAEDFPSAYSHAYLHDASIGRNDLQQLDVENRQNLDRYMQNILVMEELTRLQTNLALLRKHHVEYMEAGSRTMEVEIGILRVGDFVLVTSPGELTTEIGLGIKRASPFPHTYVSGYTNGYIYYAPSARQLQNVGRAQEDSDCILAPEWQERFESIVADMLESLE
jgi:hypothetical protein